MNKGKFKIKDTICVNVSPITKLTGSGFCG